MSKIEPAPKEADDALALLRRAENGDEAAMKTLREVLNDPEAVDVFGGDLAQVSQRTLIAKYSGKNLLVKEALNRKLELLRAELLGPDPTPLERLLVERVVSCWLLLHHLEAAYAGKDSMPLALGAYYQRCLSASQKRYLSAIKTLATVRKLALPVLQVNIARKQVNVAAAAVGNVGNAG